MTPESPGPRSLRAAHLHAERLARLREPHVAPLNALVDELVAAGLPSPWVDPHGGGIRSRVLFLLESPGPMASTAHGSGFISEDNDDPSAERMWRLSREAGLHPGSYANWNVVPWYVSATAKNVNAGAKESSAARPWLKRFVGMMPELRVVVTMGRVAQRAWAKVATGWPALESVHAPHPGSLSRVSNPRFEEDILSAMQRAAQVISG